MSWLTLPFKPLHTRQISELRGNDKIMMRYNDSQVKLCLFCRHLLPEVHREAHVPDVTLTVVEAAQNSHIGLTGLDVVNIILHLPGFPAHNGVFT